MRSQHSVMPRIRGGLGRSVISPLGRGVALCLTVATIAFMPATALATTPGDWPQFREAQTHQGNHENETSLTVANVHTLTKVWSGATTGAVNSSPATASGVVYVGSSDGNLYAFAAGCATLGGTCTPIWKGATGGAIASSPAVAAGDVFVGSADGKLYAFKLGCGTGGATCTPEWTASTGGAIDSSPSVDQSVLYIGSADGKLYAFDATATTGCGGVPKTCTPIWSSTLGGPIHSSPAATGGFVYVGSDDGKVYTFSETCGTGGATCTPLWTATTGGAVRSSPSIASGKEYVGSNDGKFYAFDALGVTDCNGIPKTCTPLWSAVTGGAVTASAAEGAGRIWIASEDGKLYSFSGCATVGGTCTPRWTANIGHPIDSSPAYSNDVLYIGASDGNVYAFQGDCPTLTCSPLWSSSIGTAVQSSPTVTNGVVYVGSNDGKLYAFGLPVDHLVVTPATMSIPSGANQTYAAEGFTVANVDLGNLTSAATFAISGSGTCLLNVCGSLTSGTYTVTASYLGAHGTATLTVTSHGSTFHALTPPVRLLDTRTGNGLTGKLAARNPRTFHITGRGGIPAGATAVTGNVTAVNETNGWAVYLGPVPLSAPTTSTVNFTSGQVTGNGLTVALAADGTLSATYISTSGNTADLVFDVTGYFTPDSTGATYHPMNQPARLLDTRSGNGLTGKLSAGTPRTFQVAGRNGVPANAKAVTGNVTVVNETNAWAVYLGPAVEPNPTTSTVNFVAGQIQGNNLTVALSASGQLSTTYISTSGNSTDLVFDVTGYYTADTTGSTYVPISPARLLDTRSAIGLTGKLSADTPRTFTVAGRGGVAANATGVTGNLTVVNETNAWAVFLGPVAQASPTTSTINFVVGDIKGNGLAVALSGTGTLSATYISTSGNTTDLVFDVTGYFVP